MEVSRLGKLGVWTHVDHLPLPEAAAFVKRVEDLGYDAIWLPEAVGRDPFALITYLAAHTERIVFATGIANIYARDPVSMRAIRETLAEATGGRFVLGLGVSHGHLVAGVRKHTYEKPLTKMREYLEAMESAIYMGHSTGDPAPVVLAALREKMLGLSATAARGAHPYFVPPEHTERARKILGPDAWLCPEQMVMLETDAATARAVARKNIEIYLGLPNYQNNLKWMGFEDADFADGGSDRLVDAIVAWGDEKVIADRVRAHHDAGADHVCIQPFRPDGEPGADERVLELFAPGRS